MKLNQKTKSIIRKSKVARLSTVDETYQPYSVPVVFVFYKNAIFIPLDEKTKSTSPTKLKRVKNIKKNSSVCLLIDEYSENWKKLFYLLILGKASVIDNKTKLKPIHQLLIAKYPQYKKIGIGDQCIKISPRKIALWKNS